MKIALLAPSGVGKTVFLAGLYGVLNRDLSHSDYGINFEVSDSVLNSYLADRYTNLVEKGDFGEGSQETTVFPWRLTTKTMEGDWRNLGLEIVDFPGAFLHKSSEANRKDVEKTVKKLAECDGFIVLVDGEGLIKGIEKKDPRALQNATRGAEIQRVLVEALQRRSERIKHQLPDPDSYAFGSGMTPVVFALTKGDLVESWLAQDPETSEQRLIKGITAQFRNANGFVKNEGAIANFMRSQFAQVIDNPDVASLRMTVTVYNEAEQTMDPKNLDTALQFVLFTGLRNALAEYDRRKKVWKEEADDRSARYSRRNREYNAAVEARKEQSQKFFLDRIGDWLDGVGGDYHNRRVSSAHDDLSSASSSYDRGSESHKRAKENHKIARYFYERILPANLVHRLSVKKGRGNFYQQGLPLDELTQEAWWQRKLEEDRAENGPDPFAPGNP